MVGTGCCVLRMMVLNVFQLEGGWDLVVSMGFLRVYTLMLVFEKCCKVN